MNKKTVIVVAIVVTTLAAGAWFAAHRAAPHRHELVQVTDSRGAVYYTCPMHPQVRQNRPGSCPICGMKLVEREEKPTGATADAGMHAGHAVVEIDPRMAQNLGMRTAEVRTGSFSTLVNAVGSVALDERRIVAIEARAAGWVERLDVRAVGDAVQRNQVVAAIYSPELLAAQQELQLAEKLGDRSLVDAARTRLELLGVASGGTGGPQRQVPIVAPQSGVVTELLVRQGSQVTPGTPLMKLADLSRVWIVVEVPEAQAGWVTTGTSAEARLTGMPGRVFKGTVDYIYPTLDTATRTLRARLAFDNPDAALKPGMYADVAVSGGATTNVTLVPSEAVIRTGTRSVVLVAEAAGRYRPVEVVLGAERDDEMVVLGGLHAGEQVVVSGQFLIDSEASLQGAYNRMPDDSPAGRARLMGEQGGPKVYGNGDAP